jgi:hypothetical protein
MYFNIERQNNTDNKHRIINALSLVGFLVRTISPTTRTSGMANIKINIVLWH